MKIKEPIWYGCNARTIEIEKFISCSFYKNEHPMRSISTENVKILAKALFERYQKKYCISDICLAPLYVENGCSIIQQLEPLDDWNVEGNYDAHWLHHHLKEIIDVLGKPTDVVESDGKYYARWIRNMVVWF